MFGISKQTVLSAKWKKQFGMSLPPRITMLLWFAMSKPGGKEALTRSLGSTIRFLLEQSAAGTRPLELNWITFRNGVKCEPDRVPRTNALVSDPRRPKKPARSGTGTHLVSRLDVCVTHFGDFETVPLSSDCALREPSRRGLIVAVWPVSWTLRPLPDRDPPRPNLHRLPPPSHDWRHP
jgi:hypothetical protein